MAYRFTDGIFNGPASPAVVDGLRKELGFELPSDYLSFLRQHDGGEGEVGDNYIVLWKAEELGRFNKEYETQVYAPGVFFFGSNAGGEGYAFLIDDPAMPIVIVPFIGMSKEDAIKAVPTFSQLFDEMEKRSLIATGVYL